MWFQLSLRWQPDGYGRNRTYPYGQERKGVIRASQVATGEENNLSIAIYGQKED